MISLTADDVEIESANETTAFATEFAERISDWER